MGGSWHRRSFLASSLGLPLAALEPGDELVPFEDYLPAFSVEVQAANPRVRCFDLRRLTSWVTSAGEFFSFHQTQTPGGDGGTWRLRIGGLVRRPVELSLEDLRTRSDCRDAAAVIECSGNSGDPRIMNGLVSNAVWTGVSLAAVLKECGVPSEAREVVFLGLDAEQDRKWEAGNAEYLSPHGWSIFVEDALSPEPLLAFAMNGAPLTAEHGFPLRLILPGWYGMANIKWLARIEVIDRRYEGRHMARNYQTLRAVHSLDGTVWLDTSIARNNLKSVIARVTRRAGQYRISGAAWGGTAAITGVDVRIDGGPWRPAAMDRRDGGFGWLLWSMPWDNAAPGPHTLVSRARNARGEVQPARDELRRLRVSNREDNSQWPRTITL